MTERVDAHGAARENTSEGTRLAWVLFVAAGLWAYWLVQHFPAAGDYRMAADEGTYFRQASTIAQEGLGGFRTLCTRYLSEPGERTAPPPFRIVHVTLAALVVKLWPSVVALSWISLSCLLASVAVVFGLGRRLWDARTAFAASLLALVSPLASGSAVRALADTHVLLATTSCLLACACFLKEGKRGDFRAFAAALGYALLLKETSYLLVPFFTLALWLAHRAKGAHVSLRDVLVVALALPLGCLALSCALLGAAPFFAAVELALGFNAQEPHAYLAAFGAGPWYEYVVDYTLLSPSVALLALGYAGWQATRTSWPRASALLSSFVAYFMLVFAAFPKNPRFALPLDPLLRIAAVAMLARLLETHAARVGRAGPMLPVCALGLLVALDVRGFHHYFVSAAIYDPVAYNLLAAERMIPVPDSALSPAQRVAQLEKRARSQRTPQNYLALSLAQYEAKNFSGALAASIAAIELEPSYAPAYNNLGLAHVGLGHLDQAIDAFEVALRLAPELEIARNNLAWTRTLKQRAASTP